MSQAKPASSTDKVYVALGGNALSQVGNPLETLQKSIDALTETFGPLTVSKFYETPCFPAGSGPDFVNAACAFDSELHAAEILDVLHSIEAEFGRERVLRWGQRTLDLDLIDCRGQISPDQATHERWRTLPLEQQKTETPDTLILPHPRIADRAFVLVPLMDVAPDWVHPISAVGIADLLDAIPASERDEIKPI